MIAWTVWNMAVIASFAALEAWAIETGQPTLSMFMATLATRWPLTVAVYGMLFGGLAVHFFWRWAPSDLPTFGG